MTLVALGARVFLPGFCPINEGHGSIVLDAKDEYYGGVWYPEVAGSITQLRVNIPSVTTARALRVGIQTVDPATGLNSGTWLGAGAAYSDEITVPVAATVYTVTLGAAAVVAVGTPYAVVVKWASDSGTPWSGQISVGAVFGLWSPYMGYCASGSILSRTCYGIYNGAKETTYGPMFDLLYSGEVVNHGPFPPVIVSSAASVALDSDGAIRAAGNRVRYPFSGRAIGLAWYGNPTQDMDAVLYSDAGNVLANHGTFDKDNQAGAGNKVIPFATPYTIAANTWYRMAIKSLSTTPSGSALYTIALQNAAAQNALDLGQDCHYTYFDGSNWTADTAKRCAMALLFDQIDAGAGGSGGSYGY